MKNYPILITKPLGRKNAEGEWETRAIVIATGKERKEARGYHDTREDARETAQFENLRNLRRAIAEDAPMRVVYILSREIDAFEEGSSSAVIAQAMDAKYAIS